MQGTHGSRDLHGTQGPSPWAGTPGGSDRLRRRGLFAIGLTLFIASGGFTWAGELQGATLPDTAEVGGQTLQLNGIGVRTRFGITVYVAGLYVPSRASEAAALIAQPGCKRIAFAVRHTVSGDAFADAFNDGIKANAPEVHLAMLKDRMDQFSVKIRSTGQIREGDHVAIDYVPGEGTSLVVNERPVGAPTPGEDFQRAVLGVFLGEKPVQDSLKNGLLGKH